MTVENKRIEEDGSVKLEDIGEALVRLLRSKAVNGLSGTSHNCHAFVSIIEFSSVL